MDVGHTYETAGTTKGALGRVLFGALWLGGGYALTLLGHLLFVPMAIGSWGSDVFGAWVVVTGLTMALRLSDMGIQSFVTNRMCILQTQGNLAGAAGIFREAAGMLAVVSGGLFVGIAVAVSLCELNTLLGVKAIDGGQTRWLVLLASAEFL